MTELFTIIAQAAPASRQGGIREMLMTMVPMVIIFAIFYFLMVRPQQRKEKERRAAIDAMRAGQRILFGSGFIGTIAEVKEFTFMVEVAPGVKIEIARGAVQRLLNENETPTAE